MSMAYYNNVQCTAHRALCTLEILQQTYLNVGAVQTRKKSQILSSMLLPYLITSHLLQTAIAGLQNNEAAAPKPDVQITNQSPKSAPMNSSRNGDYRGYRFITN